jgi:ligand-binding SRPBCC domain-containing protein
MPVFDCAMIFSQPIEDLFDYFCRPANLITLSPPDLHMQLIAGPERIERGSRITLKGRRWGLSQTIVSEIQAFEPNVRFVDVMVQGPFRKWEHTHGFVEVDGGTRVTDRIEYEPPGGLLGLAATTSRIARDLESLFAFRVKKLEELKGGKRV